MSIHDNGPAGQPPATGPGGTIEDSGISPAPTPLYTLRVNGHDLVVDGSKKGQPGDVVVVWPVKGGPLVARRLARCIPYNQYFFQTLTECRTLTVPCNKVRLIHAVIDT